MPPKVQFTAAMASREEAERIADALVERRLAACVQIVGPVRSVYRWRGAVERADEWLCFIKTTFNCRDGILAAFRELHSYDCPELIAAPIVGGNPDYLEWLLAQVEGGGDDAGAGSPS